MIRTDPAETEFKFSSRSQALSQIETRAALNALHRVLVVGRLLAYQQEPAERLAKIFDATEIMPRMLLNPAEFDDLFLLLLDGLADQFEGMQGIRDEYLAAVA